jgi:CHAT domain-containing protein
MRRVQAELERHRSAGEKEPAALVARLRRLEARLRLAAWTSGPSGADAVRPATVSALRAALDGQTLVSYTALDGDLHAVVLDGRATRLVGLGSLADVVAEAEALRFAVRRLARARRPQVGRQLLDLLTLRRERLAALLVAPLRVDPDAALVVVPSSRLHGVPWTALHDGPVTVTPSGWLWQRRLPDGEQVPGVALVAGPRLPGARDEVRALARLHPGAVVLLPPDSTPTATLAAMAGAGLAHLSCHGRLRADNPMFSELVLSDGSLTVHELDARGVAPQRVVLAACDTASDRAYDGDEIVGFVAALLSRGTRGLVASTVVVPDVASVRLMTRLHGELVAGATLARALHVARDVLDPADPADAIARYAFGAYGPG